MREDLAEWLNTLYPELMINVDNFMDRLDTGVALCKHANNVRVAAEEYLARRQARNKSMVRSMTSGIAGPILAMGNIHFLSAAKSATFFARDNVSNFISWCRKSLQIYECLLFETDDLIMRKNEKHVILCLLEVARRGAKFGMLAPMLVQMERQIDREIAADNRANGVGCGTQTGGDGDGSQSVAIGTDGNELFESDSEDEEEDVQPMLMYGPQPQIVTNDLKSLDEMVRDLVEKCTCPSQFPMVRVSEGKYRIGDTKVLIFVRILRSHVMVRVGGGWDTLAHYLDKHDPCRCKASHRSSLSARLITRTTNPINGGVELHKAQVIYDRSPPTVRKQTSTTNGGTPSNGHNNNSNHGSSAATLSPPSRARSRSRSPTPNRRSTGGDTLHAPERQKIISPNHSNLRRSMSPSPRRISEFKKKQNSVETTTPIAPIATTMSTATPVDAANSDHHVKFENVSDNGSEISDEGYRSLGLIHLNGNQPKRTSLHSQASTDDAEFNGRLDQNSTSDSQISPTGDEKSQDTGDSSTDCCGLKSNDSIEQIDDQPLDDITISNNIACDTIDSSTKFAKSGVFITDDDITVDIASTTGLRKTGFSDQIYDTSPKKVISKIPRSPMLARRNSIDEQTITPPCRKQPVYRSVRKPTVSSAKKDATPSAISTWSGRNSDGCKKRPPLTVDTFQRQSPQRTSQTAMYDKNGRRIKSTNSSPSKSASITNLNQSPLAQQLLEAAGSAKNDAQMIEKMKELLSKYGQTKPAPAADQFDDFTTAWVNSNGKLDMSKACSPPPNSRILSKKSSAASSSESTHSKDMSIASTRRDNQRSSLSRIPAPIRQKSELLLK